MRSRPLIGGRKMVRRYPIKRRHFCLIGEDRAWRTIRVTRFQTARVADFKIRGGLLDIQATDALGNRLAIE